MGYYFWWWEVGFVWGLHIIGVIGGRFVSFFRGVFSIFGLLCGKFGCDFFFIFFLFGCFVCVFHIFDAREGNGFSLNALGGLFHFFFHHFWVMNFFFVFSILL